MEFSSIATLIDAHVLSVLESKPLKNIALYVYVASKNPLVLEDNAKIQLTASEDDLQAFIQSYDKITLGSNICLDNLEVNLELGKGHVPHHIEITSKQVITEIGSVKEIKLKNFELKVALQKKGGEFPLQLSTYNYLRRMEKQELVKKNYKPSKVDVLAFIKNKKTVKETESNGYASTEGNSLDSESVSLVRKLLGFVDKEELFRVCLKKPLKEKHSKKVVRLSIIPTDVEDSS